jgi:hypothetical protein
MFSFLDGRVISFTSFFSRIVLASVGLTSCGAVTICQPGCDAYPVKLMDKTMEIENMKTEKFIIFMMACFMVVSLSFYN